MMTVRELMEALEDCDPNAEVRLAHQPAWPLQFTVAGVVDGDMVETECETCGYQISIDQPDHDPECDETSDDAQPLSEGIVWVVEGGHPTDDSPYAPGRVFEAVGVYS